MSAYTLLRLYFYVFGTNLISFIWITPHRLHDDRNMSTWVTDIKMKRLDKTNLYDICMNQYILDD